LYYSAVFVVSPGVSFLGVASIADGSVAFSPRSSFLFSLALLPVLSRRKYNLARRTFALPTTSILLIFGEWMGKVRSTPMPPEIFRTVIVPLMPAPCFLAITRPLKGWILSFSPSLIFWWTIIV